jgi:fused signal recognition particle receptor
VSDDGQKKRGFFGRLFGFGKAAELEPKAEPPRDETPVAAPVELLPPVVVEDGSKAQHVDIDSPTAAPEIVVESPPAAVAAAASSDPAPQRGGWFARLKAGLQKTSNRLADGISGVFTKRKLDADTLDELEDLLLQSDLGIETSTRIIASLKASRFGKEVTPEEVRAVLAQEIEKVLEPVAHPLVSMGEGVPHVIMFVGVNGTGKTTTIGKLASHFKAEGRSVVLAAGDTFRAAAIEQLKVWGERTGAPVVARQIGADAAGLAYDALTQAKAEGRDLLLIDTAGRLQNKTELMDELEKVVRVIRKQDSSAPHQVLLVLDATTGQNALNQVDVFKDKAGVTGLVMTKLDGTARGGILVAISARFKLPIVAIGVGEGVDDLQAFDAKAFSRAIVGLDRI